MEKQMQMEMEIEGEKKRKRKNDINWGFDRISYLPDAVRARIISFLPLEEAYRTSILSKRWTSIFFSMPILHLEPNKSSFPLNRATLLIYRFLMRSTSKLESFRLEYGLSHFDSLSRHFDWISPALLLDAEELNFNFHSERNFICKRLGALLVRFFRNESLVTLKLCLGKFVLNNVPSVVSFPNLKNLHLAHMEFSDKKSVERLFLGCPVLDNLALLECKLQQQDKDHVIQIDKPSLRKLRVSMSAKHWQEYKVDAPSLVGADIVCNLDQLTPDDDHVNLSAALDLFREIQNVRSLRFTLFHHGHGRDLALCRKSSVPEFNFNRLVELEYVSMVEYDGCKEGQGTCLVEFLQCSPNLKFLVLSWEECQGFGVWSAPETVPSCLSSHLKEMKILVTYFQGQNIVEFIAYFLKHARVLEKLVIRFSDLNEGSEWRYIEQIMSLPRSSEACQVLFMPSF